MSRLTIDHLELTGFYGRTSPKYESFPTPGAITLPIPGVPLSANNFAMVPKTSTSFTARYAVPLGASGELGFQANVYHQASMPISDINDPFGNIDGYSVVNASVEWRGIAGSNLDVRAYGKNLGNTEYATGGTSVWTTGFITHMLGAPRTYGLEARYRVR